MASDIPILLSYLPQGGCWPLLPKKLKLEALAEGYRGEKHYPKFLENIENSL